MGGILNGMALHGGIIPYGGTFLVFSDYMRPSIRLAAIMKTHVIYVFTHDSIGVGEDGPRTSLLSIWLPCAPSPASRSCGRPMPARPWRPGGWRWHTGGPGGAGFEPPESCPRCRSPRSCCARALPWRLRAGWRGRAGCRHPGQWVGGRRGHGGARPLRSKECQPVWSPCPAGSSSTPSRWRIERASCCPICRMWPWRRAWRWAGTSTSERAAPQLRSTASGLGALPDGDARVRHHGHERGGQGLALLGR